MRHIDGVYTQYFNRSHGLDGHLFRGCYKSILVDSDSYLLELLRYVHRNPLEAGMVDRLESYQWSSHKGYLSKSEKWKHKDHVLKMFSEHKSEAVKAYRKFVNEGIPGEINCILGSRKWPPVIGKESFIDWVKNAFFLKKRHIEVPESKTLSPGAIKIGGAVCRLYNVNEEDLLVSKRGTTNEPRNVAIYLTKKLTGSSLQEIGRKFGINNYSSVSTVIERTKQKASTDRAFRKRIAKLKMDLMVSQEQT